MKNIGANVQEAKNGKFQTRSRQGTITSLQKTSYVVAGLQKGLYFPRQFTQIISLDVHKAFMISLSTSVKTTSNIPDNIPKVRSLFSGKVIFSLRSPMKIRRKLASSHKMGLSATWRRTQVPTKQRN